MPVQMFPIDIPEGYEFVRYGVAKIGESTLYYNGEITYWYITSCNSRIIVRKKFEWPSWLKAAAIATDKNREVWIYGEVPVKGEYSWFVENGSSNETRINENLINLDLPKFDN